MTFANHSDARAAIEALQATVATLVTDVAARATKVDPTLTGTVTVPTPTTSTAAATKGYVDTVAGTGGGGVSGPSVMLTATYTGGTAVRPSSDPTVRVFWLCTTSAVPPVVTSGTAGRYEYVAGTSAGDIVSVVA